MSTGAGASQPQQREQKKNTKTRPAAETQGEARQLKI